MTEELKLNHFNKDGQAVMVDVSEKSETNRIAVARGKVTMSPETLELVEQGEMSKGDVLGVARIAGIMAAKKTADLIPMCHPLMLTSCDMKFTMKKAQSEITIEATVKTTGKTGVEMEALTAVAVAGLTIYDMCKAVDQKMVIGEIYLAKKTGGKSGTLLNER